LAPVLSIRLIRTKPGGRTARGDGSPPQAAQAAAPAAARSPLSSENQWGRVSSVVEQSVARSHEIRDRHGAARQQLDAAEYALHCLLEDLQGIMPSMARLKAVEQPLPEPAAFRPAMAA
jgi:hypothetical protein